MDYLFSATAGVFIYLRLDGQHNEDVLRKFGIDGCGFVFEHLNGV